MQPCTLSSKLCEKNSKAKLESIKLWRPDWDLGIRWSPVHGYSCSCAEAGLQLFQKNKKPVKGKPPACCWGGRTTGFRRLRGGGVADGWSHGAACHMDAWETTSHSIAWLDTHILQYLLAPYVYVILCIKGANNMLCCDYGDRLIPRCEISHYSI